MIGFLTRVLDFALPVLAMIFVGLVGTSVLVELGLMQKFSRLVSPIFAYTNLPDTCASALLVSIILMSIKYRYKNCQKEISFRKYAPKN